MMRGWIILLLSFLLSPALPAADLQQPQPWLGIAINEQSTGGVLIKEVLPKTPAAAAGLQTGDLITAVDTTPIKNRDELVATLRNKGVGNSVTVHFQRQGRAQNQKLKLEALPDMVELLKKRLLDKPLPALTLTQLSDHKTLTKESLLGKVVVLEFWATWCPACRSAIPRLNQWSKEHKNIRVIGVTDEAEATVRQFLKQENIAYTIALDPKQKIQSDLQIGSIPSFLLIDAKGIVRDVTVGTGEYLESLLQKAERTASSN